jgi:hypothetical protein
LRRADNDFFPVGTHAMAKLFIIRPVTGKASNDEYSPGRSLCSLTGGRDIFVSEQKFAGQQTARSKRHDKKTKAKTSRRVHCTPCSLIYFPGDLRQGFQGMNEVPALTDSDLARPSDQSSANSQC